MQKKKFWLLMIVFLAFIVLIIFFTPWPYKTYAVIAFCLLVGGGMTGHYLILKSQLEGKPSQLIEMSNHINQQDRFFRSIVNTSSSSICGINELGQCTFCNDNFLQLVGAKHKRAVIGKRIDYLLEDRKQNGELEKIDQFIQQDKPVMLMNKQFKSFMGTLVYVSLEIFPRSWEKDTKGAIIYFHDDAHEKTRRQLAESERIQAVLMSNLPGMVYRCYNDPEYTMKFVSQGCFMLTGYHPFELLDNHVISYKDLILPEFRDEIWKKWVEVSKTGERIHLEYPIKTASGSIRWVYEQGQVIEGTTTTPPYIEGLIIDIDERKKREEEIVYLSQHDVLTGVFNRSHFEKEKHRMDNASFLPLSIIFGDINGLKFINDAFGHKEGDRLLTKTAEIILNSCRPKDIVARIGGDEFGILLPNTDPDTAHMISKEIMRRSEESNLDGVQEKLSINIAVGYATRESMDVSINEVFKNAEDYMYKRKLILNRSSHSNILTALLSTLYEKNQQTEEHERRLVHLSLVFGNWLKLNDSQQNDLELLARLHDIGKIGIDNKILDKPGKLTDEEWEIMKKHPEIGYRIAISIRELNSIAEYILCHHERWDGSGYPQGLARDTIPLLARIISIVDSYDVMTCGRLYKPKMTQQEAIDEINACTGSQFDPILGPQFIKMLEETKVD